MRDNCTALRPYLLEKGRRKRFHKINDVLCIVYFMDKKDLENIGNMAIMLLNIFKNEWNALDDADRKDWSKVTDDIADGIKDLSTDLKRFK